MSRLSALLASALFALGAPAGAHAEFASDGTDYHGHLEDAVERQARDDFATYHDLVRAAVAGDDMPELREFRTYSMADLLEAMRATDPTRPEEYDRDLLAAQLPVDVLSLLARGDYRIAVLFLEECEPREEAYGFYFGATGIATLIDYARLELALASIGASELMKQPSAAVLGFGSPYNLPWQLRGFIDGQENALRRFNERLFRRYQSGGLERPHVVVDPSEGCGAGELDVEFVATRPLREFYLVPEFFYSVCLEQGRNAWSSTDCPYTTRGTRAFAAGVWRYRAVFDDGSELVERVDFGRELVDVDGRYWITR